VAEALAIDRAKSLFGAAYANVQPHSGATANAAVLHAIATKNDTILGLELAHGGHLTHGMKLNFSGRLYNAVSYGVDPETFLIDMNVVRDKALEHKPQVLIAGRRSAPSPTRSERNCGWTWPTSPDWWRPDYTRAPFLSPMSSLRPFTKHSVAPAPA
jgi:glycine/serine hydroxymethyltransferase